MPTKTPRIVVIDKANEGLAYARKSGIEAANGEYIQHLDGDDYLELDAIELVYRKAKEEGCRYGRLSILPRLYRLRQIRVFHRDSLHKTSPVWNFFGNRFFQGSLGVWSYLHKRSLYANSITFHKNLSYGEDVFLTTQLSTFPPVSPY